MSEPRLVKAPTGTTLTCKNWLTEAAYRMIQNNLDPTVAERPEDLVVYGGRGQAARSWEAFDAILASLRELNEDETLLVQSGKPVAIFRTHADAPRGLIANSNLVPHWATQEHFDELAAKGLIMYGQMTAGSWIYIGTQGILQGTYETLGSLARQRGWPSLKGKFVLTAGLDGWRAAAGDHDERGGGVDRGGGPGTGAEAAGDRVCGCGVRHAGRGDDAGGGMPGERDAEVDRADRERGGDLP